ncbi:hypothetical protein MKW98_009814 [Papaver atlanticum]|uniref:F-box domain-containing protein n=1 Tax=Papaver atlanticum TaxID=357466 RepID=A0AAD4SXN3_9MAGN|nr:hypothetical protein MKW98_009814 [Papaver atlanticum]
MNKRSGPSDSEVIISSSSSRVSDCVDIVREILSRLPVKSLMRFKCVSKHWKFSICQDQGLIDLHFTRSKQRCSDLFIVVPRYDKVDPFRLRMLHSGLTTSVGAMEYTYRESFLVPNFFGSRAINERKSEQNKPLHYTEILKPVNGLICFVNRNIDSVCILNPSTRELTPWIASSFRGNKRYNFTAELRTYCFGFDPATKQHKVICMRKVRELKTDICEVLTVGDNTWRRIDDKVPLFTSDVYQVSSVYSNGFIYWGDRSYGIPRYLNAFDVGCEKFEVIKVPKEITEQCKYPKGGYCVPLHRLLEVGGHIALLQRWTDKVVKLWICEDDDTCNGSYSKWNGVNMDLPFQWWGFGKNSRSAYFHGVAREDRIIIESYPSNSARLYMKNVSLYSYDWKKNTSTKAKTGVVSEFAYVSFLTSFTESLYPVLKVQT